MSASQDMGSACAASSEKLDDLQNEVKLLRKQMELVLNRLPPERRKYSRGKPADVLPNLSQCQIAIALYFTGMTTSSEIANALGIHRNTLIISQDFAAYRNMLRTVDDMQQFTKVRAGRMARPNGAAVGDDE